MPINGGPIFTDEVLPVIHDVFVEPQEYTYWPEGGPISVSYHPRTQCWHCSRDFHEGPLTQRVADMYTAHKFDPTYDPDRDDSLILCVGSDVCGPARPPTTNEYYITTGSTGSISVANTSTTWNPLPFDPVPWTALTGMIPGFKDSLSGLMFTANTWLFPTMETPETANLPAKYEPQDLWEWEPWAKDETGYDMAKLLELKNALWQARAALCMKDVPLPPPPPAVDYKALSAQLAPTSHGPTKKGKK